MQHRRWFARAAKVVVAVALASSCKSESAQTNLPVDQAGAPGGFAGMTAVAGMPAPAGMNGAVAGTGVAAGTGASGMAGGMEAAAGTSAGQGGASGAAGGAGMGMNPNPPDFGAGCVMPVQNATVGNACPGTPPPALKLTLIADGLVSPTHVAQAPGDDTRLYITEQQGTVRVVKDGTLNPAPLIDLRSVPMGQVNNATITGSYGEGGLLSIVFDPNFATSKRLWMAYSVQGPGFIVAEFTMNDPDTLDPSTFKMLLSYPQYGFFPGSQASNHFGSMLAFGPDGCLYVARGDGGGEYDRQMSGQDTSDDLCSILRIDPDTYPTPAPGNHEGHVWNYGFRNPWRFSFDRATGDLYIGDVGQDAGSGFEEINIEPRGVAGRNYGWSVMQGKTMCSGNCDGMTPPAVEYGITATQNSVIGGYVYRGSKIPGLVGRYVWADWTERKIKTLVYSGEQNGIPTVCDEHDTNLTVDVKVRSFGEGNDGEIYVVAGGAPANGLASAGLTEPGKLYRIDPQ